MRRSKRLGLGALLAVLVASASVIALSGCPPTTGDIRGTISVHGYGLDPADIVVRARPMPGDGASAEENREFVVSASRVQGGGTTEFAFRVMGVSTKFPYRIGLKLDHQELYPRLVWSASRDPLAAAGDTSLHFDAYAVRSEIEVMGGAEGRERADWVAADNLEFSDRALALRSFRWRSTLPDVTGGQIQVSFEPFPRIAAQNYDPCANGDEGILFRQDFEADVASGEWVTPPTVDFHTLLQGPSRENRAQPGTTGPALDGPDWDTVYLPKLMAGHPLYVRIMPKVGEELLCDPNKGGATPEVILAFLDLLPFIEVKPAPVSKVSVGTVWYTKPDYGAHPVKGETCYRLTKDHKVNVFKIDESYVFNLLMNNYLKGAVNGATIKRNTTFCVPPSSNDSNFIEDFFDAGASILTGAIDLVSDAVNYVSKLWEDIQDAVVNVVVDAINAANIVDCGKTCRDVLETGLEVGLASMGIPPSLPNFDQLVDQGVDYLAAQVASQTGIPPEVVNYASDQAQTFAKKAIDDMKTGYHVANLPDWLVPDIQFKPAFLTIDLFGPGTTKPFYYEPTLVLSRSLGNFQHIYKDRIVNLPVALPKQGAEPPIRYIMVLQPDLDGLPPDPPITVNTLTGSIKVYPTAYEKAIWNKSHWITSRYASPTSCFGWELYAISNHPDQGALGNQGYFIFEAEFPPFDVNLPCL